MPKVSVIISTYNRPERLKKAVQSVINQTYKDWELIVVADGTDIDLSLREFEGFPITRINIEHFGNHSRPKNRGIMEAKGDYIAFLDDDNAFRPDHLQALVQVLDRDKHLDVAYGDRWVIDESGEIPPQLGVTAPQFDPFLLLQRNYIDTSDVLIRREALEQVGGFDERFQKFLDWQLWVRMAKAGMRFQRVPLILTDYYLHDDMMSRKRLDTPSDLTPAWSPIDCEIELPFLGKKPREPKVAIFSITYDRLEYTKACFASLHKTAGFPFAHYVVDNGSKDGTLEYLKQSLTDGNIKMLMPFKENKGIAIASNAAVDEITTQHLRFGSTAADHTYDIIMKVDNDCLFLSDGWLAKMVEVWKSNHMLALSCYPQGLRDSPGGAPRYAYGQIKGETIGMTSHLGGICHFVDAKAYQLFRWNEDSFLHGVQDLEFSQYLNQNGYQMGYLESWFCEHYEGTQGQQERFPEYFERRKTEKTTKPQRDYKSLQERESAPSRGTIWGDRLEDTIKLYKNYFQGRVLDIGCGDGYSLELLEKAGFDATGLDISTPKVQEATSRGLTAVEGRMEELPFKDKEFGTVFCSHTLEHAQGLDKACSEIQRVGKRAIIIVPLEEHTDNPGHTSPIKDKQDILNRLKGRLVHKQELNRLEKEQVLIIDLL